MYHFAVLPNTSASFYPTRKPASLQHPDGSQFLSLPHPRTGCFSLFLPTDTHILEVQAVATSNPRSWFLAQEVVEDGKLLVMTPIDPAFLLIGLLESANLYTFRTVDDVFDHICRALKGPNDEPLGGDSAQAKSVYNLTSLSCTHIALRRVCESKDLSPDTVVYRYSKERALQYLRRKVNRISATQGLEQSKTIVRALARDGLMEDGKENQLEQGRVKATCDLVGQYLSPTLKAELVSSYDFAALNKHLQGYVVSEPLKSATQSDTKKDGDKKRKAAKSSHGVEQLKRANTTGMSKLSTFFTKVDKAK